MDKAHGEDATGCKTYAKDNRKNACDNWVLLHLFCYDTY